MKSKKVKRIGAGIIGTLILFGTAFFLASTIWDLTLLRTLGHASFIIAVASALALLAAAASQVFLEKRRK